MDHSLVEFKLAHELGKTHRVVVCREGKEESAERCLFDSQEQIRLDLFRGGHEGPDTVKGENVLGAHAPVAISKRAHGRINMLLGRLRRTVEDLALRIVHESLKVGRHPPAAEARGRGGHPRHLVNHRRRQLEHFDHLEVDVVMVGHLAALFGALGVDIALHATSAEIIDALREQLLLLVAPADLTEAVHGLGVQAASERTESDLCDGAVVQDLDLDGEGRGRLGDVRHEQQVAGLVEPVVQRVVVHLAQRGLGEIAGLGVSMLEHELGKAREVRGSVQRRCGGAGGSDVRAWVRLGRVAVSGKRLGGDLARLERRHGGPHAGWVAELGAAEHSDAGR
mmetsp:Transcript_163058/g.396220  ORF Transcript_163058/g.396220 Transcript_163058/m.396220 type:complete len:338 (+) Transcript_163058:247-1260(+)